jgi:hypothetical protein
MSTPRTRAPSFKAACAVARPIPDAQPVTMTIWVHLSTFCGKRGFGKKRFAHLVLKSAHYCVGQRLIICQGPSGWLDSRKSELLLISGEHFIRCTWWRVALLEARGGWISLVGNVNPQIMHSNASRPQACTSPFLAGTNCAQGLENAKIRFRTKPPRPFFTVEQ